MRACAANRAQRVFERTDRYHDTLTLYSPEAVIVPHHLNPLQSRGSYSATSNNLKLVHWPLIGGLLHLIQRGEDWAGPHRVYFKRGVQPKCGVQNEKCGVQD